MHCLVEIVQEEVEVSLYLRLAQTIFRTPEIVLDELRKKEIERQSD